MSGDRIDADGVGGEDAIAAVNGINLHYLSAGQGERILFVHGFPECCLAWRDQMRDFARDHHAIAPDLRGYNLSDKPDGVAAYALPTLVEDLRQFIESFGPEPVVLVAHDWGGICAWAFAAAHPEYLKKLVIINSPHLAVMARDLAHNPAQQQASSYVLVFRSDRAEALLSEDDFRRLMRVFDTWSIGGQVLDPAMVAAYKAAWARPGALTAMLNYYRATSLHPPAPGAPATLDPATTIVRVPTQVIWGEKDTALLTGLLDGLGEYVPDLRIDRIPEGTHWVAHEYPDRVNALIRDFLARPTDGEARA